MSDFLKISGLHASIETDGGAKEILRGVDMTIPAGELHVVMGPNGCGKSTLAYALAGREDYEITSGSVAFKGKDLLELEPDERAAAGIFLAFQAPVELPGVNNANFLRTAVNAVRRARGEPEMDAVAFLKAVRAATKSLSMSDEMLKRNVNVGFSGGEKKRNEVLQMTLLQPSFAVLDETDSGLDVDALRIVADGVNRLRGPEFSALVITHHKRLLDYLSPDRIHVMANGRIVHSGGPELAEKIDQEGYAAFLADAA
ncbi:Fe-S cluster assembly ATPase SufC [Acetobacter sp. AN02]|uniref:Fe-S cluster assembly ATPase SufC n=1 Tax=Acetobacter sp. AN02 TaxID=2894186 RepID=UPI0024342C9C|nr:Fe-S cluster assembly ATPase SufC [Acetobacter sp. AN02]MDG6094853.1 Fe-S cluster assembly ATPase SufC [Acetobacter sp. AN02]